MNIEQAVLFFLVMWLIGAVIYEQVEKHLERKEDEKEKKRMKEQREKREARELEERLLQVSKESLAILRQGRPQW